MGSRKTEEKGKGKTEKEQEGRAKKGGKALIMNREEQLKHRA